MSDGEPRPQTDEQREVWGDITVYWSHRPYELVFDETREKRYSAEWTGEGHIVLLEADDPRELEVLMHMDNAQRMCGT